MRRKSDGEIETIHVEVFRDLRIGGIVLFTDHPEEIVKKMCTRDGVLHSVEMFHAHLKCFMHIKLQKLLMRNMWRRY